MVALRTHCAAAARTAIADRIETSQHGIFEKGMMHMPAGVFLFQNLHRLICRDLSGLLWMMSQNKTGKWLPNNQTNI